MRKERPLRGRRGGAGSMMSLLDTDPDAWQEYLEGRRICERVAQRRINTLRLSKLAHLSGRKSSDQ